jgi:hypothetical protein
MRATLYALIDAVLLAATVLVVYAALWCVWGG